MVFSRSSSYDSDGYISYAKWYINGVYEEGGAYYGSMSTCFALYGAPAGDCYELDQGATTVTVGLEVRDNQGAWSSRVTKTYTIQQHKGRKYFLTDHIGNVRATVNRNGNVLGGACTEPMRSNDYYPFGLVMPDRSNNTANPNDNYKFTGHELDEEGFDLDKGIYHMNARGMDPVLGRMMQIDSRHEKYPGISPYAYVLNNPLVYTDMTGDTVEVVGSEQFQQTVHETIEFIKSNSEVGKELFDLLESNSATITIKEGATASDNFFDPKTNSVTWNPEYAIVLDGVANSPATILTHEGGHALWENFSLETKAEKRKDVNTPSISPLIGNAHEEKVINLIEHPFVRAIGGTVRYCHSNCTTISVYKVKSPITTQKK